MYPANGVIPELVSDVNLKRARTEINGKDAIRVVSTGTGVFTTDPQDIADGAGLLPTNESVGSVSYNIDRTKTQVANLNTKVGEPGDAAWTGTGNATVISLLKSISNKLTSF